MLRKILLATAGVAAFSLAAVSAGTAEAGGPYRYGSHYGSFGPRYAAPLYRSPSFRHGHSFHGYAPHRSHFHVAPPIRRGYPSYYGQSIYGPRGFGGSGIHYRSPGFSLRLGF